MMTNTEKTDPNGQSPVGAEKSTSPERSARSPKQIEASRTNGRKSGGPKTPEGREVSKMNALKHGLLSSEVLVQSWRVEESEEELSALSERFWRELNPLGPVEELLVDQIVTTHWRWRRALAAESGEIALSVGQGGAKRRPLPEEMLSHWRMAADPISRMQETVLGLRILRDRVGLVRSAVEREGELTEGALKSLLDTFGGVPNTLTLRLEAFRLKLQENPDGLQAADLQNWKKQRALFFLDRELRDITTLNASLIEREDFEDRARQAAAMLPSMPVLNKIMRYEVMLERQLYRAMTQLERLQRMRQGEAVPPPLKMEVAA